MLLLPATLTSREARDTLRMLTQALGGEAANEEVIVDAGPLGDLDTSALAVLLELQRRAGAERRRFRIQAAPPKLVALARLYGVDALLLQDGAATLPTVAAPRGGADGLGSGPAPGAA